MRKEITLLLALALSAPGFSRAAAGGVKWWLKDAGAVATAPLHWEGSDFGKLGLVTAGAGLSLYLLDDHMEDRAEKLRDNEFSHLSEKVRYLGDGLVLVPLMGAAYAYGGLAGKGRLQNAALVGLESYLISGALVAAVKYSVHRPRPKTDPSFHSVSEQGFFSGSDVSFPSGHSAAAFSTARTAAWYFGDSGAAPYISYGLASLVAWSRVNDNEHWVSDVVVGGAAGYFVADKVIKLNEARAGGTTYALLPVYGAMPGVTAFCRF